MLRYSAQNRFDHSIDTECMDGVQQILFLFFANARIIITVVYIFILIGEQQPEFVNSFWVGVGLWTNLFSLVLSWFVSCIIIYTSSNILDMVLNAVAVTFMLTLDDEIIGASDYHRIANWDGGNNSTCMAANVIFKKIGASLLKIHPCWQRRIQIRGTAIECCDFILCPFMIVLPFIVLFCYPFEDNICLIEDLCEEV